MIIQNNSVDFRGKLSLRNYSKKGIETIKEYYTSPEQDKLIQIAADSFAPRNTFSNYLTVDVSRAFKTLLEMIIKKPIKESNQNKIMDNTDTGVVFGDAQPARGGFLAVFGYNEKVVD